MTPAIVVIAYNRADSLKRLLASLARAYYPENAKPELIISIDKGDNEDVIKAAEDFEWKYGKKSVITHKERLGLKKHVLECGDYALKYGSAVILEDDLTAAEGFYDYTVQALEHIKDDPKTCGVSLYNHLLNVHVRRPFYAIDDGYDNYYFQIASSWGQAYTADMWQGFKSWLEINDNKDLHSREIPANVSGWSDNSWLKYNIAYLIEKDMYFLYPRVSLTTNFMTEGTHSKGSNADLQVPMLYGHKKKYVFSTPDSSGAVYDSFFENTGLKERIAVAQGCDKNECMIDLYGSREYSGEGNIKRILSSKPLPYRVIRSYGLALRPLEANIIDEVPGEEFFLYDTSKSGQQPKKDPVTPLLYDHRAIKVRDMMTITGYRMKKGKR